MQAPDAANCSGLTPRRRRPLWPWILAGALVLCLVVVPAIAWVLFSAVADRNLKAELAKLRASGAPLTLVEAAPPEVPADDNAAVLYEQAFVGLPQGDDAEQIAKFISSDEEKRAQASPEAVAEILSRHEVELRLLEQAAARPACRFPVNWEAGAHATFPHFKHIRNAAGILVARATVDAQHGRAGEALQSIRLIIRMSDHIAAEPILISQLVRISCQAMALDALKRVMGIAPLSRSDARRMYEALRRIDNMGPFTRAMEGERCASLWMFDAIVQDSKAARGINYDPNNPGGMPGRLLSSPLAPLWFPFLKQDEVYHIRHWNRIVELSRRPFREVRDDYSALEKRAHGLPWYALVTRLYAPAFSRITAQRDMATARIGLAEHALALRVYQDDTGSYPPSLTALREKVGWPLPEDPFSGKDFIYRREGNGYLLYSIGPNMKDEGGKDLHSPEARNIPYDKRPDDILWRMSR